MNLSSESCRQVTVGLFPSTTWPANILRFHLQFSEPMDGYQSARFVCLSRADVTEVEDAIVDLPNGLWTADQTVMTVLFHPGRLKSGLMASKRLGPILREGIYYIKVSSELMPLCDQSTFSGACFEVKVTSPITSALPRLSSREIDVAVGTEKPIVLPYAAQVDWLSVNHAIQVSDSIGRQLPVSCRVTNGGIQINPCLPWADSRCMVRFSDKLEDVCGNRQRVEFESYSPDLEVLTTN